MLACHYYLVLQYQIKNAVNNSQQLSQNKYKHENHVLKILLQTL